MSYDYDWPRFWIPQTEILDLSDAGFLRDPVHRYYGDGPLRTLEQLQEMPSLALLGEPGIGKSTTLEREFQRIAAATTDRNHISAYVNLNAFTDENRLYRRVFEGPEIERWKTSGGRLYLHLDSLDEAMLRIETVPHLLVEGIQSLPAERLFLRIACRTAVWPSATLGSGIAKILGLSVLELAPLRRCDVVAALRANEIDPDEFLPRLFGAHAVAFAIKPLTLRMLIALYKQEGQLPTNVGELYRKGCIALCEEQNDSRVETGRAGRLNGGQRLWIAGRIALATVLGNRFAVWSGSETDTPTEDVHISAFAGANEDGEVASFTVTDADVREVLDTGLFSARGSRRMGWAHHSYAEFLAANYLIEKEVSAQTILKALTHPSGGLIPPLAIVGAWAASLDPEIRATLIASDPWTLLRGDLSKWADTDLSALVDSLLVWIEAGKYHEYFFGIHETYERLRHPDLAAQLKATITARTKTAYTRQTAIGIAERCKLQDLQPELLQIVQDQTENPDVRAACVAALRQIGDGTVPGQILALLQSEFGADPDGEIRGYALDLLWPEHINAAQLFQSLIVVDDYHVGSYAHFFFDLPDTLKPAHLNAALEWATAYIGRSSLMNEFREKTLADAIMFKSWDAFDEPNLVAPFMAHIAARLRQHGELCRGTDYKAKEEFVARFRDGILQRRQFLRRLCEQEMDRLAVLPYIRNEFARREDLEWFLEISPGGRLHDSNLNEQSLISFISFLFQQEDNEQFEALFPVAQNWPLLRQSYIYLLDAIDIDSSAADGEREQHRQMQEWKEKRPPPAVADIPAEIEACLSRAESGEWIAWCWLNLFLMLSPDSPVVSDTMTYFLTETPGWVSASAATKHRIVLTALPYLMEAVSSVEEWFGRNPKIMKSNDLSAVRALVLLRQTSPETYDALPQAIWRKWAPVIIGLGLSIGSQPPDDLRQVKHDALTKASDAFLGAVGDLIKAEKDQARAATNARGQILVHPFFVLKDVEDLLDNEALKLCLLEQMGATDNRPEEYAAILALLLRVEFEPAIAAGIARIANFDESDIAIVEILWRHSAATIWPLLWQKLNSGDELAKALLTKIGGTFHHSSAAYHKITPDNLADLYLLMIRLFPADDDPGHPSGFVTPRQMITSFRDGIVRFLVSLGTDESVRALMRLAAARPDILMLPFELSRGEAEMRLKTWSPLTIKEAFALTDRRNTLLVTSPIDLLHLLISTLSNFAAELHGLQTPVRALWDRQGTTHTFRPIDENGFSDAVVLYLRQKLQAQGVIANREVEITRRPGSPVGQRTDILINAIRLQPDGRTSETITAVIEVKGCWNSELLSALNSQLVLDYMVDVGAPIGLYLVGWFDQTNWDAGDTRRLRVPTLGIDDVRSQLDQQARSVQVGLKVRSMVMEIRTPGT